jgi:hypothetical protein
MLMALSRIATVIGAALLSRTGRRVAGRHAGKLALATLAFELWKNRRDARTTTRASAPPSRRRWSGRGPRS